MSTQQILYKYWIDASKDPITQLPDGVDSIYDDNIITSSKVIKLGIKAPPGTQVVINDSIFMVGASGTFTVNKPNYKITSLRFIKPVIVTKDETITESTMQKAVEKMGVALSNLLTNGKVTVVTEDDGDGAQGKSSVIFDETYTILNPSINYAIYSTFLKEFTEAYYDYGKGYRGIYYTSADGDLRNILIDLEIEEEGGNN